MKPVALRALFLSAVGAVSLAGQAAADTDRASTGGQCDSVVAIRVLPSALVLDDASDQPRVLVLATTQSGTHFDVTKEASFATAGLAVVEGGLVRATRTGKGTLRAQFGGHTGQIDLTCSSVGLERKVSFVRDVLPTLTRAGCNQGACHGSASGKNGFALSLFGYDPERDHYALAQEWKGRRVDRLETDESLVLLKACRQVAHKGGQRFDKESEHYRVLADWIRAGAPSDIGNTARVVDLRIEPASLVLTTEAGRQRVPLIVRAIYDDGQDRDVSRLALLSTTDASVIDLEAVDTAPTLVAKARGEVTVLARFASSAATLRVLVHDEASKDFAWPEGEAAATTLVDRHLNERLRELRIAPQARCSDEVFVRRAYIDLVGTLPSVAETKAFLASTDPGKRHALIDRLVATTAFSEYLALEWVEALRIEARRLDEKGARLFDEWVRAQFVARRRFDEVVRDMVTASGPSFAVPQVNLYVVERDPKLIAEHVAQAFLGVRLSCAQCHDHPFERWTMDDYYGFAAFFARVTQKRGEDVRERIVYARPSGEVLHARTKKPAAPKFLGAEVYKDAAGADRRTAFAAWLTARDNPWFARNVANRLFARVFKRGIVDAVDDVRISNPASHPALLDALARRLADLDYDLGRFVAELCKTRAYERGALPSTAAPTSFAGRIPQRLDAEVLYEAVAELTAVRTRARGAGPMERAYELKPGATLPRFLGLFGRSQRESACTCERSEEPNLAQILHLQNGPEIEEMLRHPRGRIARLLASKASDAAVLEELFLAAYARRPFEGESSRLLQDLDGAAGPARQARFEDLLWAMLNSKEFLFCQ